MSIKRECSMSDVKEEEAPTCAHFLHDDKPTEALWVNQGSEILATEEVPASLATGAVSVKLENPVSGAEQVINVKDEQKLTNCVSAEDYSVTPEDLSFSGKVNCVKKEIAQPLGENQKDTVISSNQKIGSSCHVCGKKYKRKRYLDEHLRIHTKERPYNCSVSNISQSRNDTATVHDVSSSSKNSEATTYHDISSSCKVSVHEITPSRDIQDKISIQQIAESSNSLLRSFTGNDNLSNSYIIRTKDTCFRCDICEKTLKTKCGLKAHLRVHTGEKPFPCDICGKKLATSYSLKVHRYTHTGEKPHKCHICGESFRQANRSMKKHVEDHNIKKEFSCGHCKKGFDNNEMLKKHMHIHDMSDEMKAAFIKTQDGLHKCGICGITCKRKSTLKIHLRIHTGDKPYLCDICDRRFSSAYSLKHHRYTHTGEKPYHCDMCGKAFRHASVLVRHVASHSVKKETYIEHCTKEFEENEDREITSSGNSVDICETRASSSNQGVLFNKNEYLKISHGTNDGFYTCGVCGKKCGNKCQLKVHLRVHTGEKPYSCDFCGKRFTASGSLKSHRYLHTGEKPYSCKICGASFRQTGCLQRHVATHTEKNQFVCDYCNKAFSHKRSLKQHRKIHTGAKPFKCYVCDRYFTQKCVLNRHLRIHTGEKPYKCDVCDRQFSLSWSLDLHKRAHIAI